MCRKYAANLLENTHAKVCCFATLLTLQQGSSPVNLLHISRKLFCKNTYGRLLLKIINQPISRQCYTQIETSQLIFRQSQWTGFHISVTLG